VSTAGVGNPGRHSLQADGVLVLVTLLASSGWLFSYHALSGLPPLLFIGIRFLSAGLILGAWGRSEIYPLRDNFPVLRQCLYTGLVLAAAMMCWVLGLHFTTALGVGAFISSLGVIIAPILAGLFFHTRISRNTWLAAAVASFGMACLALQKGMSIQLADVFFFASAIGFSVQFNLNSRFAGRIPVLPLVAIQLSVVGLVSLLGSVAAEPWPASVPGDTLMWLSLSVLSATCLRFYFQIWAQSRTPLSHAAFIMTLEPVWAALFAAIWLGERMRSLQLLGCALILVALVISRLRPRRMAPNA